MMYLQALATGFAITIGIELALGLCLAIGAVLKGENKNEKH